MARAVSAYQSREFAERQLTKWLLAGELHWRSELPVEGLKRNSDPGSGDPEFWRDPGPTPSAPGDFVLDWRLYNMKVTWDESCAWRGSYTFYRIEVAADDLTNCCQLLLTKTRSLLQLRKNRSGHIGPS
jgi:hypothetical protein